MSARQRFSAVAGARRERALVRKPTPHDPCMVASTSGSQALARGGADEQEDTARLIRARQNPGLHAGREILADALSCRATAVVLDYTQQAVAVRYQVDGVWLQREPLERESGDPALEALKLLSGLNPQDRQNRQAGNGASALIVAAMNGHGETVETLLARDADPGVGLPDGRTALDFAATPEIREMLAGASQ